MKTYFKTGFAALMLLLVFSCKKEVTDMQAAEMQKGDNAQAQPTAHYLGERFGGGVIFYMDAAGEHGLIADTVDIGRIPWWNGVDTASRTRKQIGSGKANTRKIVLTQGRTGTYAALLCAKYRGSGYTDWFLPSKDELNMLYLRKYLVGEFDQFDSYWSSTEYVDPGGSHLNAWCLVWESQDWRYIPKWGYCSVRAIRAF